MWGFTTADRDGIDGYEISVMELRDRHDCSRRTPVAHDLRIERVEARRSLDVNDIRRDPEHVSGRGTCRAKCGEQVIERLQGLNFEWQAGGVRAIRPDADLARYEHQATKAHRVAVVAS